nr:MAG TPA: TFIIB Transcription factor zinc-finger [Caudoviricetes sp.]
MMEIKYYCDNCKGEVVDREELTAIFLSIKIGNRQPNHKIEICNCCLEELGFDDCKNDANYIKNYSNFVNNIFNIAKKILKR